MTIDAIVTGLAAEMLFDYKRAGGAVNSSRCSHMFTSTTTGMTVGSSTSGRFSMTSHISVDQRASNVVVVPKSHKQKVWEF